MSTLKLCVRYGGEWSGLEYVGGEDDVAFVPAGDGGYQALWDSVHHCVNADTNLYRYIFESYVDLNDHQIRKRKLKTDDDVFELFRKDRYPVVFVSVIKIRPTTTFTGTNIFVDEGTSHPYDNNHGARTPNIVLPLEIPNTVIAEHGTSTDFGEEWGLHGDPEADNIGDDVDNVAPGDNVAQGEGNLTQEGGAAEVFEDPDMRAKFEDFMSWYKLANNRNSEPVGSTNRVTFPPYLRQQSTGDGNTNLDSDIVRSSRWLIPGAPTTCNDSGLEDEEGGLFMNSGVIRVGALYTTKEDLTRAVGLYHMDKVGEYRIKYSDKKRLKVLCKSKQCPFMVCSSNNSNVWRVYKVIEHTCTLDPTRSGPRRLPSKILGAFFAPRLLAENSTLIPRSMMSELEQRNSIHSTYQTALRAKHHALTMIFGDEKQSFANLPSFLYTLKEFNPGSVTDIEIDPVNHVFTNAFFALAASINGFANYGRPVIVVDGTHLKGKYNGIMFVATTLDGNRQVFPLAIGVGHVEDDSTWKWFLDRVKLAYGSPENLVIVSDAHKSIGNAVNMVYPEAHHCFCYHHMQTNMKHFGSDTISLFKEAAFSFRTSDYELAFATLRTRHESLFQKLINIGPHKWARSLCPVRRYEFMTSNAAEVFNKRAVWARTLPISSLLEVMRAIIERWFYERRTDAESRDDEVSHATAQDLVEAIRKGARMSVERINANCFKVRDGVKILVVDLANRTCSCGYFDQMLKPCSHAAAAIRTINHNINAYVGDCYKTSVLRGMWGGTVMPIPELSAWVVPSSVRSIVCLPPDRQRQAGRPRRSRFSAGSSRSASRSKIPQHCSRCGGDGHNIVRCEVVLSQQTVGPTEVGQQSKRRARKKCSICSGADHTRRRCPSFVAATDGNNTEVEEFTEFDRESWL